MRVTYVNLSRVTLFSDSYRSPPPVRCGPRTNDGTTVYKVAQAVGARGPFMPSYSFGRGQPTVAGMRRSVGGAIGSRRSEGGE